MKKPAVFISGIIILLLFCVPASSFAQTLSPGDIVVLGFNADQNTDLNGDGFQDAKWAIAVFKNISAGTVIRFTDAGIKEDGSFFSNANNEGHLSWVITTNIPAGRIFTMDCVDGSNFNDLNGAATGNGGLTDYGTVSGHLGGTSTGVSIPFSTSGDQVIIYQGTSGTTTGANFIYAFSTQQNGLLSGNGAWQNSGAVTIQTQSFLPPGLTNGSTAIALTTNDAGTSSGTGAFGNPNYGFNDMAYQGIQAGTKTQLLNAVGNPSNWTGSNSTAFNFGVGSGFIYASHFTVSGTLPLTWGIFEGESSNGIVSLRWTTLQEINTFSFDIEYAGDGVDYVVVGNLEAKGNSITQQTYTFSYSPTLNETVTGYYRIRQTDTDGRFSYSSILRIKSNYTQGVKILQNPVTNNILSFTAPYDSKGTIMVITTTGTVVAKKRLQNTHVQQITLHLLPAGSYQLLVITRKERFTRQFIKR